MENNFKDFSNFIDKQLIYAVVGASNNRDKYGNQVFRDLTSSNFKVVPINLKEEQIEEIKAYSRISDMKEKPDIVIFVIPSQAGIEVIKEVKELGIKKAWFQPGSESKEILDYCKANKIDCIVNHCIMVERRNLNL